MLTASLLEILTPQGGSQENQANHVLHTHPSMGVTATAAPQWGQEQLSPCFIPEDKPWGRACLSCWHPELLLML